MMKQEQNPPCAGYAAEGRRPARPYAPVAYVEGFWLGLILFIMGTTALMTKCTSIAHSAEATVAVDAADILRTVREAQSVKRRTLEGQLRTDAGVKLPFLLVSDGPRIQYRFQPPAPAATFQVQLNDENSQLQEVGTGEKLTPANFDKPVLSTDLTYEDLALRFLYWSRARIVDEDTVKTRRAWKIRADAPGKRSEYSSVNLWIDKESGALLKAEGFGWDGNLHKRFDVISAQKIEGAWYLKQMRIETLDPAGEKVRSRTYLEIKGVAP